jgi:hypothetical protein
MPGGEADLPSGVSGADPRAGPGLQPGLKER